MSNFEKAVSVVLDHEGGYSNNPSDPGGETKYGISKRSYPNLDIKNLTVEQAKEIYRNDFWNPNKFDSVVNDDIATKVFDTLVNVGSKRAFRFAQESLNKNGFKLTVDGLVGPQTISALNSCDPKAFLAEYRKIQANYYRSLVDVNPKLSVFLRGWLIRAES